MQRIGWILVIFFAAVSIADAQRRIATVRVPLPPPAIYTNPKPTDLKPFKPADGYFSVVFAGKAAVEEQAANNGDIFDYRANHGPMRQTLVVGEFEFEIAEPGKFLERYRSGLKKETLVSEREITLAGRPGKEFIIDAGNNYELLKITVIGNRLYSLGCAVDNWQTLKKSYQARVTEFMAECDRFFGSFEILRFPPPEVAPKPDEFIGFIDGRKYENPYFGVAMTLPAGWSAIDDSEIRNALKSGAELSSSESEAFKRKLAESIDKELVIFGAGAPISKGSGANLMISVRKQAAVRSIDVINASRSFFAQSDAFSVGEARSERRDGVRMSQLEIVNRATGIEIRQNLLVIMRRGYSVSIVLSYRTDAEKGMVDGIIRSIAFK